MNFKELTGERVVLYPFFNQGTQAEIAGVSFIGDYLFLNSEGKIISVTDMEQYTRKTWTPGLEDFPDTGARVKIYIPQIRVQSGEIFSFTNIEKMVTPGYSERLRSIIEDQTYHAMMVAKESIKNKNKKEKGDQDAQ